MSVNRYEKKILRAQKRQDALKGEGVYVYRNNTSGDLYLPRPTKSGIKHIGVNEVFQGDSYYMFMVEKGELRIVEVIQSAQDARNQANQASQVQPLYEAVNTMHDKLITEQPPTVTNEGTVEYTVQDSQPQQKPLNETPKQDQKQPQDILLNENPLDGVEII
jgi:hypothetical protein